MELLRTAEEMREKIFRNMSARAAEMMREDLESKGPVRLSEVEAQQKQILIVVRRLADEGLLRIELGELFQDPVCLPVGQARVIVFMRCRHIWHRHHDIGHGIASFMGPTLIHVESASMQLHRRFPTQPIP